MDFEEMIDRYYVLVENQATEPLWGFEPKEQIKQVKRREEAW